MPSEKQVNILLVDDRRENLLALAAILSPLGHTIVAASSGEEALKHVLHQDFAVILLDVQMPEMDGFETAELIRGRRRSQHIPIIFLTAVSTSTLHVSRGYLAGAVDYLFKPVVPEILCSKVAVFVDLYEKNAKIERQATELASTIKTLQHEIAERNRAEEHIGQLNANLIAHAAQLEATNRELETFSYAVAHDLRAPLRSIDGFSQALLEDYAAALDTTGQDYLQRVRTATQRMRDMIDGLLTLSRNTRGELFYIQVDLSALAQTIAGDLQQTQPERQVEWIIADGLIAEGDARLLRMVLENLLGNAWKFSARHPHARIEFGGLPQDDGNPVYFVRDNGAGFDMAYVNKLFGTFQRLHSMSEFAGTGIGLATVQRIIHRHGGRVWAEAAVDHGATFYFTLSSTG